MAQVILDVQAMIGSMNQFMGTVQRLQQLTAQFNFAVQRSSPVKNLYIAHHATTSRMARLHQVLMKTSASFQSGMSAIMSSMGTIARTFLRGLVISAEVLMPIVGVIGTAAAAAAGWAKWIWNKMVDLGDSMLQDFLFASGTLSTIGGIRAFGTAFGRLPSDPNILPNLGQARGSATSQQFLALQLLGVKRFKDTADIAVQATLAAGRFMKAQPRGMELLMAEAHLLTSIFSREYLIALRNMDEQELLEMEKLYNTYKDRMKISDRSRRAWTEFSLIVKAMGVKIESTIAEVLGDPNSGFVKAVSDLSKSIVHFFQVMKETKAMDVLIKKLKDAIEEFSKWLKDPKTEDTLKKFMDNVKAIAKYTLQVIEYLKTIVRMFRGEEARKYQYGGRRRLAERGGLERPPGAPPIVPPAPRYPGRVGLARKIGMPAPPAEAIPPSRGRPGQPSKADEPSPSKGYTGNSSSVAMSAMMDQLRKEGVPEANVRSAAALLVGQAQAESNLNPNLSHDQGTGYGIYGARLGRRTAMLEWLKSNGYAPNSLEGQSRYMAHEAMTGKGYGATRETLRRATPESIDTDSDTITKNFESPAVNNSRYRAGRAREAYRTKEATPSATPRTPSIPKAPQDYVKPSADAARTPLGPGQKSTNLAEQRKQIGEELKNPETRRLLAASTNAEVGGQGPEAEHAYIESVINRSLSRKTSLTDTLRDRHYYPQRTKNMLDDKVSSADQARIDEHTGKVLAGSNITNYGTGNESGTVRSGGAQVTRDYGPRRERFIRENADLDWVNEQLIKEGKQPLSKEAVKDPHSGQISVPQTGPGERLADLPSRPGHSPELKSVDPRLRQVLSAGRDQFEAAHPGYKVTASSGRRYGKAQSQHGAEHGAVDVMIVGPDGREISNEGNDPTGLYHEYARHVYGEQRARYPELSGQLAWGGAFGTQLGGGGAPDLMHFDIGGERGHWTQNLPSKMGPMPGVKYGKPVDSQPVASYPERGTTAVAYAPSEQPHPIERIKVDNRSDDDVSHAKTSSDNDSGHPGHHEESGTESSLPPVTVTPEDTAEKFTGQADIRGVSTNRFGDHNIYGADLPSSKFHGFRKSEDIDDRRERTPNIRYSLGNKSTPSVGEPEPSRLGADLGMSNVLEMEQKRALSEGSKMSIQGQIDEYEKLRSKPTSVREKSSPSVPETMADAPDDI